MLFLDEPENNEEDDDEDVEVDVDEGEDLGPAHDAPLAAAAGGRTAKRHCVRVAQGQSDQLLFRWS